MKFDITLKRPDGSVEELKNLQEVVAGSDSFRHVDAIGYLTDRGLGVLRIAPGDQVLIVVK